MRRLTHGARRPARAAIVAAAVVVVSAACGSQLDPVQVASTQQGSSGVTSPGAAAPQVATDNEGAVTGAAGGTTSSSPGSGSARPAGTGQGGGRASGVPADGGALAADGGVEAGDCRGFANGPGITDRSIRISNVADISGPVPGLFQSAQDATKAFFTYYNVSNPEGLCGRSIELNPIDARSDAGADQQAYVRACEESFAAVGSLAQQDQGGAQAAEDCGLPDLRAFSLTPDRAGCATCFASYAIVPHLRSASLGAYWKKAEPEATERIGIYYVDVPSAAINAKNFAAAFESQGLGVVRLQPIATSEFNYAPYAQQMKDEDIRFVMYFGAYPLTIRLQQAMEQQGVEPVFLTDPTVYDQRYVEQGGETVQGTHVYAALQLFEDASIPEMVLYRQWLERTTPGASPNAYGLFAWSAARLFIQTATELGGDLSRETLVQALRRVDGWTANGVHAPMAVGSKVTGGCLKMIRLEGTSWRKVSPGDFVCGPTIDTRELS